jgi:glycosyltransferase involved in cell wall biosynthesis
MKRSFLDPLVFNPDRFARYEKQILPQCKRIIVVVEEAASRLHDIGIPAEKITIVGNTERVYPLKANDTHEISLPESALKLLYVGGFGIHRGLETVIQAMPEVCQHIPSAKFIVVGDGPERYLLEQLTRHHNISHAIRFEGRQPFEKVHHYIMASDICLVPHLANSHTNTTMPHKLFQYMFGKKAVLVSSAKPLARVVEETQCGCVFEAGNPAHFVQKILQMQNIETRMVMGENGYRAVIDKYNWQKDARRLTNIYNQLD